MRNPNDLWEAIGDISEEEIPLVLTKLFSIYEQLFEQDKENKEAVNFFRNLDNALVQTVSCNLNRR